MKENKPFDVREHLSQNALTLIGYVFLVVTWIIGFKTGKFFGRKFK